MFKWDQHKGSDFLSSFRFSNITIINPIYKEKHLLLWIKEIIPKEHAFIKCVLRIDKNKRSKGKKPRKRFLVIFNVKKNVVSYGHPKYEKRPVFPCLYPQKRAFYLLQLIEIKNADRRILQNHHENTHIHINTKYVHIHKISV